MQYAEQLLQFAWKFQLFSQENLRLSDGELLQILHTGMHNRDAGPDFLNARLKIGDTVWAGNVEIHRCSSDWYRHGHQDDPAYRNVLLHVVQQHDAEIQDFRGRTLPTLCLSGLLPEDLLQCWQQLEKRSKPVPCTDLGPPEPILVHNWLDRMLTERMELRSGQILAQLKLCRGNWQEVFYRLFVRAFGFHVNALPFEMLAQTLPLTILTQHVHSRFQLEALFFGQSGLLPEETDEEYVSSLLSEYAFLQHKYRLVPLKRQIWKFMRMRPANFPTLRIAQLSACIHLFPGLLQSLIEGGDIPDFTRAELSPFWQEHYHFNQRALRKVSGFGAASAGILVNNVIAPIVLVYGKQSGQEHLVERALDFFRKSPPEHNRITALFKGHFPAGLRGGDSQAMLHLKTVYCDRLRCTDCAIGQQVLGGSRLNR